MTPEERAERVVKMCLPIGAYGIEDISRVAAQIREAVEEDQETRVGDQLAEIVNDVIAHAKAEAYKQALADYKADGLDIAYKQGLEDAAKIAEDAAEPHMGSEVSWQEQGMSRIIAKRIRARKDEVCK